MREADDPASLLYNPRWHEARLRYTRWWHGVPDDRPLLQVLSPRSEPVEEAPDPPTAQSHEDQWMNADLRMRHFHHQATRTRFGGDAVPYFDPHLGPGAMALYLGSKPTFQPTTVWFSEVYDDLRSAPLPGFDETNSYWQWSLSTAAEASRRFHGKALVAIPDLCEGVDILASLLGAQRLLYHMMDEPGQVRRFLEKLHELYFRFYDPLYDASRDETGGSCFSAFSLWGPGRVAKVQCDFSAMISPGMFREFVQPYLREQCRRLDYPVYHWDGPDAVQHMDALMEIDELRAIQWTPGAGQPGPGDRSWWRLYRPVIDGGKSLMLCGVMPHEIDPLIEEFGPSRLNMTLWCRTEEEAIEIADRYRW